MYQANLSFRRREKYVEDLIRLGLIGAKSNSPVTYTTTERGREWLKNYEKIRLQ
jgi:predicted transcriptional regulator